MTPSLRSRIVKPWRRIEGWRARFWSDIRPGPEARRGAIWGGLAAAFAGVLVAARYLQSGFGLAVDTLFCFVAPI